ncbi:zinc finger, CCHC-type containing protein [Tanacetum coccineum]
MERWCPLMVKLSPSSTATIASLGVGAMARLFPHMGWSSAIGKDKRHVEFIQEHKVPAAVVADAINKQMDSQKSVADIARSRWKKSLISDTYVITMKMEILPVSTSNSTAVGQSLRIRSSSGLALRVWYEDGWAKSVILLGWIGGITVASKNEYVVTPHSLDVQGIGVRILTGEKSMRYSGRSCDWVKISSAITPEKNLTGHEIFNRKTESIKFNGENSHLCSCSNYPEQDPEEAWHEKHSAKASPVPESDSVDPAVRPSDKPTSVEPEHKLDMPFIRHVVGSYDKFDDVGPKDRLVESPLVGPDDKFHECKHVDNKKMIKFTKDMLKSKFDMKDMGLADVILGKKIIRSHNGVVLSQAHYVDKILNTHNAGDSVLARTSIDTSLYLSKNRGVGVAQLECSRIIGMLMYLMTSTRSDLAYAVSRLSRYTSNPSDTHWKAMTMVLHYLRYSRDYTLHYDRYPAVIEGYIDANWISDVKDSRSTSGYVFTLGGGAISWKSSKQMVIAKSTMESEFIALDKCGEETE